MSKHLEEAKLLVPVKSFQTNMIFFFGQYFFVLDMQ